MPGTSGGRVQPFKTGLQQRASFKPSGRVTPSKHAQPTSSAKSAQVKKQSQGNRKVTLKELFELTERKSAFQTVLPFNVVVNHAIFIVNRIPNNMGGTNSKAIERVRATFERMLPTNVTKGIVSNVTQKMERFRNKLTTTNLQNVTRVTILSFMWYHMLSSYVGHVNNTRFHFGTHSEFTGHIENILNHLNFHVNSYGDPWIGSMLQAVKPFISVPDEYYNLLEENSVKRQFYVTCATTALLIPPSILQKYMCDRNIQIPGLNEMGSIAHAFSRYFLGSNACVISEFTTDVLEEGRKILCNIVNKMLEQQKRSAPLHASDPTSPPSANQSPKRSPPPSANQSPKRSSSDSEHTPSSSAKSPPRRRLTRARTTRYG